MTLRARLGAGLVVVVVTLAVALVVVGALVRLALVRQLDAQLAVFTDRAAAIVVLSSNGFSPGDGRPAVASFGGPPTLTNVYVGVLDSGGRLVTVASPTDDTDLLPAVSGSTPTGKNLTVASARGSASRVRVTIVAPDLATVPAAGPAAPRVVFGLPTTQLDASLARVRTTILTAGLVGAAVLALVAWWVVHLGLRPLREVTALADAIGAGERDRRAPRFPAGTEAASLSHAVNTMLDTNQAAEDRLRRFVADASHELRTPLTTVRGYSALYQAGGLTDPDALADAMRRVGSEATRMGVLVDDLLLLAELDEQRPLDLEPLDPGALVADIAADLAVTHPQRTVVVTTEPGCTIDADRARLTQAVLALTTNAVRHTPPDTPITLTVLSGPDDVRISVSDTGPGIPAEHLPHIFDRFYRVDPSRVRRGGGSGLGLSIVQAIARSHTGSCTVESIEGQGATFTLRLPARRLQEHSRKP